MDTPVFKKNVFRTLSVKSAKYGLRNIASNTQSTNVVHGILGLNTEVGGLLQRLQPYLLGFQLNNDALQSAFEGLGGVLYFTVILAKTLSIKIPGSGKKVHLQDLTKTEAILRLNTLSSDLMYHTMDMVHGEDLGIPSITKTVEEVLAVLWPLTYDLVGVTPSMVMEDYSNRLAAGLPTGLFDASKEVWEPALKTFQENEKNILQARIDMKKSEREAKKAANVLKKLQLDPGKPNAEIKPEAAA